LMQIGLSFIPSYFIYTSALVQFLPFVLWSEHQLAGRCTEHPCAL